MLRIATPPQCASAGAIGVLAALHVVLLLLLLLLTSDITVGGAIDAWARHVFIVSVVIGLVGAGWLVAARGGTSRRQVTIGGTQGIPEKGKAT